MTLLFTGASGFLGSNIIQLLNGAYNIISVGLSPQDTYLVDIATDIPTFTDAFDVVFHAAGKAHSVPKTEAEERLFFDVNLQGTKNLCTALERSGIPKAFIFISTVAVYGCDSGENITEEHPLNGTTPYALSKIKAEKYLQGWCAMHNVKLSILRPSLIAGPNPPGNLGAMIHGIKNGKYLSIAGGKARKSVLMVQDIANLLPMLIEKGGIYNVCDSYQPSFRELEMVIYKQLNKKLPLSIPYWFAKSMAIFGDCFGEKAPINSLKLRKITHSLTFSNEKAMRELGWKPMNVLKNFRIE
ncbi:NAD-dependent epimerase/dehydratase family protein [Bacteroides fragilis]|jgi:GlcNAc-P-P-Und epimerase|uniref:NAD-dependent epimerase/dehydratase family protein n=1 Tax=Bacteroides fragilis TaxID=817 RepID=UPI001CCF30D6|nr:NAD-dependent epimerase/dehydratase family protein [Bacteroides fragilis]MCS2210047.1 NAD-dependent epimerase/dehydratase family protein [Bacteroides fragilis]MCS2251358.1 NAD-dependent epimerase/dehydratase family protein [Bacteroides fragilis]MCY1129864.1 NAD-dependent epimerase/dehydratase family protein [Bacteroides fragilis]UBF18144.1 NAD-dependent epimerase/dehydratase family protein [Bacteroides fragilis]UVR84831.1 NAD-dependent epimerase/dehydratase family protein [Bacteroides fragi